MPGSGSLEAKPYQAPRNLELFVDRTELIREFAAAINEDPPPGQVFFFHGDGGNGKSLLLRFLETRCCHRLEPDNWSWTTEVEGEQFLQRYCDAQGGVRLPVAAIDLESAPRVLQGLGSPESPLLDLRRQLAGLSVETPLFDYAVVRYLHGAGVLTAERIYGLFGEKAGFVEKLVRIIADNKLVAVGEALLGLLAKSYQADVHEWLKRRKISEEWFDFIRRLGPNRDLLPKLPVLFAEDLHAALQERGAPARIVILIDSHDRLWPGPDRWLSDYEYHLRDQWLREMVNRLDSRVIVAVAGREQPGWETAATEPVPGGKVRLHRVGELPEDDARDYLRKAGVADSGLQDAMLALATVGQSGAHPLYLGMMVDVLEAARGADAELKAEELPEAAERERRPRQILELLLRHAPKEAAACPSYQISFSAAASSTAGSGCLPLPNWKISQYGSRGSVPSSISPPRAIQTPP